jgi:hypothetical protein
MVFLLNSENSGGGTAEKRPLHGGTGGKGCCRPRPCDPSGFQQIIAIDKGRASANNLLRQRKAGQRSAFHTIHDFPPTAQ